MNSNNKIITDIVGIGIIVLAVLFFTYKLVKTSPDMDGVAKEANPVETVNPKLLGSEQVTRITKGQKNGVLPIAITDQLPKENPFIKLEQ